MCSCFMAGFPSVRKEEKNEETERVFERLYLGNGWRDSLQMYVYSRSWLAFTQRIWSCYDKGSRSYERREIPTLFFV